MTSPKVAVFLLAVMISGCSVAPTVRYTTINNSDEITGQEEDFFYLQSSIISIAPTKDPASKSITDFSIQSTPTESTEKRLSIIRDDPFYAKTTLNITKRPNTDLVSEMGASVKDYRVSIINTAGSIITKVASYSAQDINTTNLPIQIDMSKLMSDTDRDKKILQPGNGVTIVLGAVPTEAKPLSELPSGKVKYAIFSACRQATVLFTNNGTAYQKNLKISDPRYYQFVAFPIKGKVSFHNECGVSTTNEENTGVSTSSEIVNALATQGTAIKDAIDAAKKDEKK